MDVLLPLLIMVMLVLIHQLNFKSLCRYLEKQYPDQWKEVNSDPMGLSGSTSPKLQAALKNGYFASLNDEKVSKYKTIQRFVLTVLFIVVVANIGYSLWL